MSTSLLTFSGVSFTYAQHDSDGSIASDTPAVSSFNVSAVVSDISFTVHAGECVVLCGPSGCGKSSILRLANGLAGGFYPGKIEGHITIDSTPAQQLPTWQRAELIGSVFQEPATQFFSNEMAGEVAFAGENLGMEREQLVGNTDALISSLGLDSVREIPNDALSSGQKQKVAIASALAPQPKLIAMDEPSSNLDEEATWDLGKTLHDLKDRGYTLLVAEHRLAYLMGVADRFIYIHDGRIASELTPNDIRALSEEERLSMGVRCPNRIQAHALPSPAESPSLVGASLRKRHVFNQRIADTSPLLLVAHNLSKRFGSHLLFSHVNFACRAGDIVAVTGRNGAGKTTMARILVGLDKPSKGKILINSSALSKAQLRSRVWYTPNDVRFEFFTTSVLKEVMLGIPDTEENRAFAQEILRELGLWEWRESYPTILSGGQRQRLSIACGLVSGRDVIILDEPTSGLDAQNMQALSGALRIAAERGKAIVVITHDCEFINSCATSIFCLDSPETAHETYGVTKEKA